MTKSQSSTLYLNTYSRAFADYVRSQAVSFGEYGPLAPELLQAADKYADSVAAAAVEFCRKRGGA